MKKSSKILSAIISVSMLVSMLPAQFVSAADAEVRDKSMYNIIYGTDGGWTTYTHSDSTGMSGHVYKLTKVDGNNNYDYTLTVSAYNIDYAMSYISDIIFDTTVVKHVRSNGNMPSTYGGDLAITNGFTEGTVSAAMSADYETLGITKLFTNSAVNYYNQAGSLNNDSGTAISGVKSMDGFTTEYAAMDSKYSALSVMLGIDATIDTGSWNSAKVVTHRGTNYGEYKAPKDELVTLYTTYFKLLTDESGNKKSIGADTFTFVWDKVEKIYGSGGLKMDLNSSTDSNMFVAGDTYLVGFTEPVSDPVSVKFTKVKTVVDSVDKDIEGAAISIYDNEAMSGDPVKTGSTLSDGSAEITGLTSGKTYYYKVSKTPYNDLTGSFDTTDGGATVDTLTMYIPAADKYTVTFRTIDADTEQNLTGVALTINGTENLTTSDTDATAALDLESGQGSYTASKDGYSEISDGVFNVIANGNNNIPIRMTPIRIKEAFPVVTMETTGGTKTTLESSNVSVKVEKKQGGSTLAWADGYSAKSYSGGTVIDLPKNCEFEITVSASGCTPYTMYAVTDDSTVTYWSDSGKTTSAAYTLAAITLEQIGDPYYSVVIAKDTSGTETKYVGTVKLHNISLASYGTFGLQYDKDVFKLDSFELDTANFALFNGDTAELGPVATPGPSENLSYHVFKWMYKDVETNGGLNISSDGLTVATYTFSLVGGATENDITTSSFEVMPYDKTYDASVYRAAGTDTAATQEVFDALWRYTDEKNEPDASTGKVTAPGRLDKSLARLNGFFQVYDMDPELTDNGNTDTTIDVFTTIDYDGFDAAKNSLKFIVTDANNVPLENAEIALYDDTGSYLVTLTTDSTGMVNYPVSNKAEVTYSYSASKLGYWDNPEKGRNNVTIPAAGSKDEYVVLEQKVYHDPVLKDTNGTDITDLKLTGDLYAYNGRVFHFNIEAAQAGKTIPEKYKGKLEFTAIVTDDSGNEQKRNVTYDGDTNTYVIAGTDIIGSPNTDASATIYGLEGKNIVIKLTTAVEPEEDTTKHAITANAGTNGYVTYTADDGTQLPATTMTPLSEGAAKYSNITIADIAPTETLAPGTFHFYADSTYVTEKVYINGVEATEYEGLTTFDYQFTDITVDNDISVTFWDGENPSSDTVITLVVGNYGKADVSQPETANDIRNTRKTFISSEKDLEFTLTPDPASADNNNTTYVVDKVRKSIDGGDMADVAPTSGTSYTVAKPDTTNGEKSVTVYVTFKEDGKDASTDVFVTSYVKEGNGTITPVGVFTVNKHTSFSVTMAADIPDWTASSVDVNGVEYKNTASAQDTYSYTVQSIASDTKIGAIFAEKKFSIKGYVDLSQGAAGSPAGGDYVASPASVTFVRKNDDGTTTTVGPVLTTKERTNAMFTAELAQGTWDVTVVKLGYVTYTVTGFVVDDTKPETDSEGNKYIAFGKKTDGTIQKIMPYIGNTTGTGKSISILDVGNVSSGLRTGAASSIKTKANVDDSTDLSASVDDMSYVKKNYGRRAESITYDKFME